MEGRIRPNATDCGSRRSLKFSFLLADELCVPRRLKCTKAIMFVQQGDIPMNRALAGKVALVSGGSRGIGAATAKALADHGADVTISYAARC